MRRGELNNLKDRSLRNRAEFRTGNLDLDGASDVDARCYPAMDHVAMRPGQLHHLLVLQCGEPVLDTFSYPTETLSSTKKIAFLVTLMLKSHRNEIMNLS